ncbi:UNVERIFIED_CONTAM: hypothetical protein FKN15_042677 [Acipenser sinensis]
MGLPGSREQPEVPSELAGIEEGWSSCQRWAHRGSEVVTRGSSSDIWEQHSDVLVLGRSGAGNQVANCDRFATWQLHLPFREPEGVEPSPHEPEGVELPWPELEGKEVKSLYSSTAPTTTPAVQSAAAVCGPSPLTPGHPAGWPGPHFARPGAQESAEPVTVRHLVPCSAPPKHQDVTVLLPDVA